MHIDMCTCDTDSNNTCICGVSVDKLQHGSGFPGGSVGKEFTCNAGDAGDMGLFPGSGISLGGGHGNPLQYSCLGNLMDRGAWQATVHGVAESLT